MTHTIERQQRPQIPALFITQQRKLRDFLADQDRIATIKSDWLYQIGSPQTKFRLLLEAGFRPAVAQAETVEDPRDLVLLPA